MFRSRARTVLCLQSLGLREAYGHVWITWSRLHHGLHSARAGAADIDVMAQALTGAADKTEVTKPKPC